MRLPHPLRIHKVRNAIVIPLVAMFLITVASVTSLVYFDNQRMVRVVLRELQQTMQSLVADELNSRLERAILLNDVNEGAYQAGILNLRSPENRERYFANMLANIDGASMAYVALPDGSFFGSRRNAEGKVENVRNNAETSGNSEYYGTDADGDNTELVQVVQKFDPRTRPWYKAAVTRKGIAFGTIYSHFVFREPTLTVSLPAYEGGDLVGVFGVDYLMTWLGETMRKLPVGPNGQVFIMDADGLLVATTTGEGIFSMVDGKSSNIPAVASQNEVTRNVAEKLSAGQEFMNQRTVLGGKTYLVGLEAYQYGDLKWQLCTIICENDFLQAFQQALLRTILRASLLSMVFILFAIYTGRHISQPVLKLNKGMMKLRDGEYEPVPYAGHLVELKELTDGFNEMGTTLSTHVDTLEMEVKKRTVELEEKNHLLFETARMDELMGIPNRRRFDEFFRTAVAMSSRNGHPIGLLMLDIDFFKSYNDTYGHLAGDECLRQLGTLLSGIVHRHSDLVARYGGEELVVIIQEASESGFREMAEHIRLSVEKQAILHEKSEVGFVTVSIGAVFGAAREDFQTEHFLLMADDALYESKANGRNRISFRILSRPSVHFKPLLWKHAKETEDTPTGGNT